MKQTAVDLPERAIRRQIRDALLLLGVFAWETHDEWHRPCTIGIPDLIGVQIGTGRMWAVEVKRPGEQTRDGQSAFLQRLRDAGAVAIVATCAEDVLDAKHERD